MWPDGRLTFSHMRADLERAGCSSRKVRLGAKVTRAGEMGLRPCRRPPPPLGHESAVKGWT